MATVTHSRLFGAGVMSPAYSRHLRMVGEGVARPFEVEIAKINKLVMRDGKQQRAIVPPYMPEHLGKPLHPGGNSVCFAIQIAHLMGARRIFLAGFTLQSGSRYFFGQKNPVLHRASIYDSDRACHWLKWYEAQYPGHARLLPGWSGPIYDVLGAVSHDELEEALRKKAGEGGDAAEQHVPRAERDGDQSVHADAEQPRGDEGPSVRAEAQG